MPQPIDLPNGYYSIPPGKLVNVVTWLEMRAPPPQPIALPLQLVPVTPADTEFCCGLFKTIGTPWLWSRAYEGQPGETGAGMMAADTHFAMVGEERVGILELAGRGTDEVEITWFGLIPDATGQGLGRRMMAAALHLAWDGFARRVWLHTCNFDHPAAIGFYRSCGFVPCGSGFEIMDDPRLSGDLPRSAAPHVPLIEGSR